MKSHTTARFRRLFNELPQQVQALTRKAHGQWTNDPHHPGLDFKRVHVERPIYSVRIGIGWRALGVLDHQHMYWFWIGSHADYDELLKHI